MKIEVQHEPDAGSVAIAMAPNCQGDSTPLLPTIRFQNIHQPPAPDTAALAAAIVARRWCGEVLQFKGFNIGIDAGDAILKIATDVRFVQPVDGVRRALCEGSLDLFVVPAAGAPVGQRATQNTRRIARLLTWSGEFVAPDRRSSSGHIVGEVSTNADIMLTPLETAVTIGLLVGGSQLGSLVVPADEGEEPEVARLRAALRILSVELRTIPGERKARARRHPGDAVRLLRDAKAEMATPSRRRLPMAGNA